MVQQIHECCMQTTDHSPSLALQTTLLAKANIVLCFCFVFMASIKFLELLQLQFDDTVKTEDVTVEAIIQHVQIWIGSQKEMQH